MRFVLGVFNRNSHVGRAPAPDGRGLTFMRSGSFTGATRIRRGLAVVAATVALALSGSAWGDDYQRAVHFECDSQSGRMSARLYTLYEHRPLPAGDHWFAELASESGGLSCRLSDTHEAGVRALASVRQPANDNLQVVLDGRQVGALSVDQPSADPTDGYAEDITISLTSDHLLAVTKSITHKLK